MSHLTEVKTEFKDAEALKKAAQELGFSWQANAECRFWNDQSKKFDYVIKLKGPYDVGVRCKPSGELALEADLHAGYVEKELGNNLERLKQQYAAEKIKIAARLKAKSVRQRRLQDGTIEMFIGG